MNFVAFSNHPVHIADKKGNIVSPSALIPFCEFGGNMSIMGVKIDSFQDPVCTSFKPKILRNQICYEVDPKEYEKYLDNNDNMLSLTLLVNFNNERQLYQINSEIENNDDIELMSENKFNTFNIKEKRDVNIFIETIGKKISLFQEFLKNWCYILGLYQDLATLKLDVNLFFIFQQHYHLHWERITTSMLSR